VTLDPNILAHSALVTTDIGVSLFFLAGIIDYGVMVYRGTFQVNQAAALSRAQNAYTLLGKGNASEALAMAREAVSVDPEEIISLTALGDIAAVQGQKEEARKAWQAALASAKQVEPDAQVSYVPALGGEAQILCDPASMT
jgi:tetratricopeptide (TPR) repeat protein